MNYLKDRFSVAMPGVDRWPFQKEPPDWHEECAKCGATVPMWDGRFIPAHTRPEDEGRPVQRMCWGTDREIHYKPLED